MTTSTATRGTSSDAFRRRCGWIAVTLLATGLLLACCLLGGCATTPAAGRWEATYVAGTGYAAVFRNGLPQAPGLYTVNVTEPGKADFYRQGKFVGRGRITTTEPMSRRGITLDVPPGTPVTIQGQ